jgi:peptide deformylase
MTVLKITEYPAKVLNTMGDSVEVFDEELGRLCSDMFETM